MTSLRRALIALAALGLVMGLGAAAVILTSEHMDHLATWAVLNAALGGSFVATGLYAWWRRPNNHSGALITWVGFLWFFSALGFSNDPVVFTLGQFTESLPIAGLIHLVLAVPSGQLESRYHRGLVAFAYLNASLLQLPAVVLRDTGDDSACQGCPGNPFLIGAHDGLADLNVQIVRVLAVGVIALVALEVVRRVRRSRGQAREVYGPVVYAGAATLGAFACLYGSQVVGGPGG